MKDFVDEEQNPFAAPESDLAPEKFGVESDGFVYGGFVARIIAVFVDFVVLYAVGVCVGLAGWWLFFQDVPYREIQPEVDVVIGVLIACWVWLYFSLQESSSYQATLGKRVAGLRVQDLAGQRISFGRATGRTLGKVVSYASCWIGFLMQPFTPRRQMLHDMLAGCIVVKRPKRSA